MANRLTLATVPHKSLQDLHDSGQRNEFCRAQGLPEDPFCSLDHNPVPSMPADGIRKGLGVTHQVCRPEKGALPRKTTWFCLKSVALQFDAWSARLSPVHRP